ncbi:MAG: outer membrane lipoprotein carrier protein LolA [Myxococcales bacterium]|nr:outer membrane lipoprotein carrier protein LolA [Myxococcota bacterium]MDW8282738.1 outer membrane lipoprotein carrier protein LolA [Myxococcales bacterium]
MRHSPLLLLLLLSAPRAWGGPAAMPPPRGGPNAEALSPRAVSQLVERVQRVYEATNDLHARFQQTTQGLMGTRQAAGQVWLKKPGKMRWDYDTPEKKHFIADGTLLWVYEPEDEQAFRQPLSSSQLPAQVSFLFGKGRLQEEFEITALEGSSLGGPGDAVLKLVPRVPTAQYRYLAFVVDLRTALVKETVVYDQQGGSNRIVFSNIETNVKGGIDDSRFRFTPPPGTKVLPVGR